MEKTYKGRCHCGKVRYSVKLDLAAGTGRCNCSYCAKVRNWGVIVKPEAFQLEAGEDDFGEYRFGTHAAQHLFCKHCGVRSFGRGHIEQLGGDYVSVQVSCLDGVAATELAAAPVRYFNGKDNRWDEEPAIKLYL